MYRFGLYYIGVSNNWRRLHRFPMLHTKRYPHERKCGSKRERVKYNAMKSAGCKNWLIYRYAPGYVVYWLGN